jgi:glycosyltransferase involved in cell wall biosynthesis
MGEKRLRLAVVATHPIQYYAPWFRWMTSHASFELRVFYLWNPATGSGYDPGFGHKVEWDLPLLDGYEHEFVPNTCREPGTSRFFGLRNPDLLRRLQQWQPDAALLLGYRYASLLRLITIGTRTRGFPLLVKGDSHRIAEHDTKNPSVKALKERARHEGIRAIFRWLSAGLYVGTANREYFLKHGVPAERLFFSPHAVENERFTADLDTVGSEARAWRASLGIPSEHLLVLFAGKFEPKKRPLDLLDAFRRAAIPQSSLLFAGAGDLEDELRRRSREVPNIFFAPFQNQTQMPRTYAACDLFVLPSYGPEETWGLAINEAFCLARPVIVSKQVGCASDLVQDKGSGWIFPAGDVEALAQTLREALNDRDRLRRYGERGREIIRSYTYQEATQGLEQALRAVTDGRPCRSNR